MTGVVEEGINYAFNFANPTGVKLLSNAVLSRLQRHLSRSAHLGNEEGSAEADETLFRHGLIERSGIYWRPPSSESPSLSVWLNIIDACNFGCFYCYIPELQKNVDPDRVAGGRYSLGDANSQVLAKKLVAYCKQNGLSSLNVKFAGGEPTLVIDSVDRFCAFIKSIGSDLKITFTMLSNGRFSAETVLPVIERWKIGISISIDGMEVAHDRVRFTRENGKRRGSWAPVMENVARLIDHGAKPYFLYTITKKNLEDVAPFAQHVLNLGCGFRLSLERGHRPVDFEDQQRTADYLVALYRNLGRTAPTTVRFERAARFAEWNLKSKKLSACSSCRGYLAVGRDGGVSSCQMRMDEPVGNLLENQLNELVGRFDELPATRLLSRPEERRGGCAACEFRHVCAGGCPQHTRNVWETMNRPSPWCYVYGTVAPVYIEAAATHLARRAAAMTTSAAHVAAA